MKTLSGNVLFFILAATQPMRAASAAEEPDPDLMKHIEDHPGQIELATEAL